MSSQARFKAGDRVRFHNRSSEPHRYDGQEGVVVTVTPNQHISAGYGVQFNDGATLGAGEDELESIQSEKPRPV